jgi:tRNA threonylcarbamoyladenosine biosynthesis protein TsaB
MIILALDTTTAGSVAVLDGSTTLVERGGRPELPHATRLPGDLLDALSAASRSLDDVALLAVAAGPGAFTGLRIGIATMQGLAFARGVPLVGVSALDALADAASDSHDRRARPEPHHLLACMDAARGEVFAALYRFGDGAAEPVTGPLVGPIDRLLAPWSSLVSDGAVLAIGGGAMRYRDAIERWRSDARIIEPTPWLARWIGLRAREAAVVGVSALPHAIQPLYVRRPDAELARDRAAAQISR